MSESKSLSLRKQGGKFYADAFQSELEPAVRILRAEEALKLFLSARNAASHETCGLDWIYATKNLGMTSFRLADMQQFQERSTPELVYYHFGQGITYLLEALVNGKTVGLAEDWISKVDETLIDLINRVTQFSIEAFQDWRARCAKLESLIKFAKKSPIVTSFLFTQIANEMTKAAILLNANSERYQDSLSILNGAFQPINFAHQFLERLPVMERKEFLIDKLSDIENTQRKYLIRTESTQKLEVGHLMLHGLLFDEADFNMDQTLVILDKYFEAALCSRSEIENLSCHESEAKAMAAIGQVYHKILKNEERGHQFLLQAVTLASSVTEASGLTFFKCEWYQQAKTLIEEYRAKKLLFDESKIKKEREPTLIKLAPKLTAMKDSMKEIEGQAYKCFALMTYVYKEIPPKEGSLKADLDKNDNSQMKKACLMMNKHYHPDKNRNDGIEWYILCEEIVKEVNSLYELLKSL